MSEIYTSIYENQITELKVVAMYRIQKEILVIFYWYKLTESKYELKKY